MFATIVYILTIERHSVCHSIVYVVVLVVLVATSEAICPHCTCPAEYDLVCARRKDTGRVRGFPSRCVLDCNNLCRPARQQFEFLKRGRCGNLRPRTKPPAGARTTTTTPVSNILH